jgi:hypothetical protein
MANSSWIETKRDADLDESGNQVLKKVQLEPAGFTGKSKVDLVLRIIGLVAIATPIFLFYLQQRASLNTQKAIKQLEIYSATANELSSITRRPVNTQAFAYSKDQLLYDLPPKIAFLFNEKISLQIQEIDTLIPIREAIVNNGYVLDSFYIHGLTAGSSLNSYRNETVALFDDSTEVLNHLKTADSSRTELLSWIHTLNDLQSEPGVRDTAVKRLVGELIELDNKMATFYSSYLNAANTVFALLMSKKNLTGPESQMAFNTIKEKNSRLLDYKLENRRQYKSIGMAFQSIFNGKISAILLDMRGSNGAFRD